MNKNFLNEETPVLELLSGATAPSYAESMTRTVNISDAKANLSKLADEVASGDQVIVSKAGQPVMKLVPLTPKEAAAYKPKTLNGLMGKYAEEFKDFDWEEWDRLDDEVRKIWSKFGDMD